MTDRLDIKTFVDNIVKELNRRNIKELDFHKSFSEVRDGCLYAISITVGKSGCFRRVAIKIYDETSKKTPTVFRSNHRDKLKVCKLKVIVEKINSKPCHFGSGSKSHPDINAVVDKFLYFCEKTNNEINTISTKFSCAHSAIDDITLALADLAPFPVTFAYNHIINHVVMNFSSVVSEKQARRIIEILKESAEN